MLKLEKKSRSSELTVHIRAQEPFFEPILLKSLIFAFSLHVLAYVLFQITPFHFSSEYTFSPIKAISRPEYVTVSPKIIASLEETTLLPPFPSLISNLTLPSVSQNLLPTPNKEKTLSSLEKLEGKWTYKPDFNLPIEINEPSIQLNISGDLADQKLLQSDPMLLNVQPVNYKIEPKTLTFKVRLNAWSGKLFWTASEEPYVNKELRQKAEAILSNLKFEPPPSKEELTGKIIFTFLENYD